MVFVFWWPVFEFRFRIRLDHDSQSLEQRERRLVICSVFFHEMLAD